MRKLPKASTTFPKRRNRPPYRTFGLLFLALVAIVVVVGSYFWLRTKSRPAQHHRDSAVALYQRALKYERDGDDEQALAALDQAIELDAGYESACVRAAFVAYELEEDRKSADYLARCRAVESQDEALRLKAQALTQILAGDSTRAMELYQVLVDRYPQDTDSLFRFAELATDLDRVKEAERAVRSCLAIEPDDPYCQFQSMFVKLKQNRFDDVLADYNALPIAVRQYPWFDEPLGVAYLGNGQLDQAIQAFEHLSKRQPQLHGTAHFTTGKEWVADVLLYEGE